jgi:hypothetical protein
MARKPARSRGGKRGEEEGVSVMLSLSKHRVRRPRNSLEFFKVWKTKGTSSWVLWPCHLLIRLQALSAKAGIRVCQV